MATYTIKDTAPVVYAFAKANIKKPLLSILPYVVICGMLTAVVDKSHPLIAMLAQFVGLYLSCVFASNMHRAFLHGVPAESFDPFRPSKDDKRFMGVILLLGLIIGLIFCSAFIPLVLGIDKTPALILAFVLVFVAMWVGWRLALVLPDRAVGGHMKLQESFHLTKGLVWKLFVLPLVCSWLPLLACIGWCVVAVIIDAVVIQKIFPVFATKEFSPAHKLILYTLVSPATIGISFWCSTVGVATLSNYYLWVKQNRTA